MEQRFRSLAYYLREVAGVPSAHFLQDHSHPVLMWSQNLNWTEELVFQFETSVIEGDNHKTSGFPTISEAQISETSIIEVRKQTGHGPANMICVGRAGNNDIIFPHETISKLHAYFLHDSAAGSYEIADADSTNGTKVNNRPLLPYQNQALVNRDRIQFGSSIQVLYLAVLGFYDFLQQLLRSGIL